MSLGEDNRLSILIQAKIDEASTQTMQKQLDTLSKNLKAVKISLDLGNVEGQFLSLTKEIQKESSKMFANNGIEVQGLDEAKKSIQELRKESEKAFKELDKLGDIKGVKNMVVDAAAGTKSFQAEVSNVKEGMEHISKINVFGKLNQETQEWEYQLAQVGNTMKKVLSSFNYNEYTAEINKYFQEYSNGFVVVGDYYKKLQELMKSDDGLEQMKALPDDVRASMEKHYTEIENKARDHQKKMDELEKRNASFGNLDESIQKIKEFGTESDKVFAKMKELGDVKGFSEIFDTDGNLTGYKVQVEEIKNNIKSLDSYNVIGRFSEETNQWEYALDKVSSKMKEVTKAKDSNDFGKSVRANLDDALKGVVNLEEGFERVSKQLRNKGGTGDFNGYFKKLPKGVQDEILADYEKLQKKVSEAQDKELKIQEKQQEEFDKKWLASQERKVEEELAIKKAQREATFNNMVEERERTAELLELEKKVDQARKEASKTIDEYKNSYGEFADADELRKIQLAFNAISVDTKGLTTNVKETEAELKKLSKALETAGKNAKNLKIKDDTRKEKEYEKEFQKLLKEEEVVARQSVKFEEWKRQQQYKEAENYHKKIKALEQKYDTTKSAMDTKIVKVKYDLVGFIDEGKLDEIQEAMKFINVETMAVDFSLDEINKDISYWKNQLDDVVARAEQVKKAHDEAQAIAEKNAKREIDIADRKEKVEKRINELRGSGLKVNEKELKSLEEALKNVDYTSSDAERAIRKISERISELEKEAKQSAKQINGLGDVLKTAFAKYSLYDAMQLGKDAIREMVQQVIVLDDALVELQKVSDLSGDSLKNFTNDAFRVAETVGRMGSDVVQSTADFKKMGYEVEESLKLAETAMVYSNVGDNVSPEEATKTLISTMKAFNIEAKDSISIIDKINAVSNNFAISSEGLGSALQRSASALMEANNSLDETLALYAVGNTIAQDPESVSTGLRTISMRLRGVDEETNRLIPKFRELFLEYTNGKVDIMDTNDQFKSTFDIIRDLGKEWEKLSDIQQANLAELTAGKQRANIFMSLMSSSKDLEKALGVSMESMGSAMAENEKAMDSVTGKINQLKSALQQLSINTISSDFVKGIVDMLTVLVKLVDQIGLVNISLVAFTGYLALSKSNFAVGMVKQLGEAFKFLGVKIGSATVAQLGMNTAMMAFAPVAIITAIMGVVKAFDLFIVSAEEQKQKLDTLQGEYDTLTSELKKLKEIANPSQAEKQRIRVLELEAEATANLIEKNEILLAQKEILGKGDGNPFKNGVLGDTKVDVSQAEYLIDSIQTLQTELDGLIESGADDTLIRTYGNRLEELRSQLNGLTPELTQARAKLEDSLKIDFATPEQEEDIRNLIKTLDSLFPNIEDIVKAYGDAGDAIDGVTDKLRDVSVVMDDFREEEKQNKEETSKLADEYIELVDTIKQVEEGKALTLAQAKEIVEKYGLEYSAITQVADGYGVELTELKKLQSEKLTILDNLSKAENSHKEEAIKSILARVQAINEEIKTYGDLLRVKQQAVDTMNSIQQNAQKAREEVGPSGLPVADAFKNWTIDGIEEDLTGHYQEQINIYDQAIADYREIEKSAQDRQDNLNALLGGYTGTLKSSQGKKSPKSGKSKSYISENLDILINDILKKGEEVERAIAFTSSKLDNAIAKGDKANELALKEALADHMQDRVKTTADTANQLRAEGEKLIKTLGETGLFKGKDLKQLTEKQLSDVVRALEVKSQNLTGTQAESVNLLKSKVDEYGNAIIRIYQDELPSLSQQWWGFENARISQAIGLVDEKYDRENRLREDTLRDIELQQLLVEENSEAHINLEKQKYQILLKQQRDAKEAMRQLKEAGLDEDSEDARRYLDIWYDAEREKRNMLKSFAKQQEDLRKEQINLEKEKLEESKKSLETLLDMTIKMIKQEEEAKKKALQEELNGYKKIIDAKKQSLKDEKDERDHAKNLEEKQKSIKKVEDKLLELSNDNSAKAMAEKRKLEEELFKLKEDLADYQYDHSLEKQEEALDKEYDAFEENINKELKKIEDYLSKEGNLRAEAIKLIESKNKDLYDKLLKWNQEYGDGLDITVTEAWETAHEAMESYNNGQMNVLNTLENITQKMKDLNTELKNMNALSGTQIPEDWITDGNIQNKPDGGTIKPQGDEYQNLIDEIAPQMNRNSDAWKDASEEERKRLEAENERLSKKIGAWKGSDGRWYVTKKGYDKPVALKDLYPEYHTGGVVGGQPKLKSTEEFAKLLKGEVIVTQHQMEKFMKTTLPNIANQNIRSGVELQIDKFIDITVEGNLDNKVDIEAIIKRASNKALDNLVNTISNRGIKQRIGII